MVQQPEQYLRETLQEIAFMHKHGDFNGKWELKEEYKAQDDALLNPTGKGVAPKQEGGESEMEDGGSEDGDGGEEDDEDVKFEDV